MRSVPMFGRVVTITSPSGNMAAVTQAVEQLAANQGADTAHISATSVSQFSSSQMPSPVTKTTGVVLTGADAIALSNSIAPHAPMVQPAFSFPMADAFARAQPLNFASIHQAPTQLMQQFETQWQQLSQNNLFQNVFQYAAQKAAQKADATGQPVINLTV